MDVANLTTDQMTRLVNARTFIIPAMRSGLVKYSDGLGILYVSPEFLEKIAKTAEGNPLIIKHEAIEGVLDETKVQDVTVVGRVIRAFKEDELWYWEVQVEYKEAAELLEIKDWGVSTGWVPTQLDGQGGELNQVPYDAEAIDGYYEHLAIVDNPRYEMAKGAKFLNSLQTGETPVTIKQNNKGVLGMLNIFKKQKMSDGLVKVGADSLKVSDMLKVINEAEEKKENEEAYLNAEDEVTVNGETMTVADLVKKYEASMEELENSEEDKAENEDEKAEASEEDKAEASDDDKAEGSEDEDRLEDVKENSEDEKEENEGDCDKAENSVSITRKKDSFKKIKNSAETAQATVINTPLTMFDKVELGKSKWGSK